MQPYVCALFHHRVESAIVKVATDMDAAASQPGQEQKAVSKVKQKARAFLQEMVANISPAFIRYIVHTRNLTSFAFQLGLSQYCNNLLEKPWRTLSPRMAVRFFIVE